MKNFEWCVYTYRHRIAFKYVVEKLIKDPDLKAEMLRRARIHDLDKVVMYLFMDQHESQLKHVQMQRHHVDCKLPKTYADYVENIIDYECAPYTKPDKPLNAYDFVIKLREMQLLTDEVYDKLMGILHDLGIDRTGTVEEDISGREFISNIGEVTEEMILMEVLTYIDENRDNSLNFVKNHWQ